MKPRKRRLIYLAAILCLAAGLAWVIFSAPKFPIAVVRVEDAIGHPVVGAVITPHATRTKPGPYASGWYTWDPARNGVPADSVTTDSHGRAQVPYPKYVFERIETAVVIFSVNHADYVPDELERTVATTPPMGAPLRMWLDFVWARIQHKALLAQVDPVVLKKGATLKLSVAPGSAGPTNAPLFAQMSARGNEETNYWSRPQPGVLVTRRLAEGTQMGRAFEFAADGSIWFSDWLNFTAVIGQTNNIVIDLKRGLAVHGRLDETVPRPVQNGRVVAHVWPQGVAPSSSPPQWHAWARIRPDGTFDFASLPPGDLEIVALCQGFVSTNNPKLTAGFRHPQKHLLTTNDIAITVGMEPTARLEVLVTDDRGKPLPDVTVSTWPNVRYGDWGAVILLGDLYNTADGFSIPPPRKRPWGYEPVPDFQGKTDQSGLAVIPNLPLDVFRLAVGHAKFDLPAVDDGYGQKNRFATFQLVAGQTNHLTLQLEPLGKSPITHY